jgi:hypothetical protein
MEGTYFWVGRDSFSELLSSLSFTPSTARDISLEVFKYGYKSRSRRNLNQIAYIDAYIKQKMGYSLNCNPLIYMEPAGGIEPPTY